MIHTLELSTMISKSMFESIPKSISARWYKRCYVSTTYADKGFSVIRLYKFKRKSVKGKVVEESDLTHHYMISLTINIGQMFGEETHYSNNILMFTPDFVRAIYFRIFDLIPCLEQKGKTYDVNSTAWLNGCFKVRRIDFSFDFKGMHEQYLTLINRGYSVRKNSYERTYYDDVDIKDDVSDDEPNIPEVEALETGYDADVNYIYYKSKGVNINVYHKETEILKEQLKYNPNVDYDFLRIEIQVKKTKLNSIVKKFGLKSRELLYLATPKVEEYVLNSYIKALTGTGVYVTLEQARKIIANSSFTKSKKQRLIAVVEAVSDKHGIAKVLEQVENGKIVDLGTVSRVKGYLRDIHGLGINPVTVSARMGVPKQLLTNITGGNDMIEKALPSLVDVIKIYNAQIKQYQQQGIPVTQEDLNQIDNL